MQNNLKLKIPTKWASYHVLFEMFLSKKIQKTKSRRILVDKIQIQTIKTQEFLSIEIKKIISLVVSEGNRICFRKNEKISIIPALKKFEELGDKELTGARINQEVSGEMELVRPTIRNWINDYIQKKGAQAHDNLARSDFLYRSENTESLSSAERDKLSVVLRYMTTMNF